MQWSYSVYLVGSKERSGLWVDLINSTLNRLALGRATEGASPGKERVSYKFLQERHLVGIMLCVFVKSKHAGLFPSSAIQSGLASTGILGFVGNKGAVSIRLSLQNTDMCFVCAHFAAHRDNVESRNQDYVNILAKTSFKDDPAYYAMLTTEEKLALPEKYDITRESFGIEDHDYVFWLGDFNYRMQVQVPTEDVFDRVNAEDLAWLLSKDQLNVEKASGRVFNGCVEPPITFRPTYKFQGGTSTYDQRPEKKLRAPAWCDRVLYKSRHVVQVEKYTSVDTQVLSDHKPVVAQLGVSYEAVDKTKRSQVFQEVIKEMDKMENDAIPKLELDKNVVEFPDGVKYCVRCRTTLTMTNKSAVALTWRFVPKLEDNQICKNWLSVTPQIGMIPPNEHVVVQIEGLITATIYKAVLRSGLSLDDILWLRVEKGNDLYIPVSARVAPTCFGQSLVQLVNTRHWLRATEAQKEEQRLAHSPDLKIPKELWHLFNYLWLYGGLQQPGLFMARTRELHEQMVVVRTALDTGFEIPPPPECSSLAVAEVIVEFLEMLPDPVVPVELFPAVDFDHERIEEWSGRFLQQLPVLNQNVFVYIISFLREMNLPANNAYNRVNVKEVSRLFTRLLLRPSSIPKPAKKASGSGSQTGFELPQWFTGGDSSNKQASMETQATRLIQYFIVS